MQGGSRSFTAMIFSYIACSLPCCAVWVGPILTEEVQIQPGRICGVALLNNNVIIFFNSAAETQLFGNLACPLTNLCVTGAFIECSTQCK